MRDDAQAVFASPGIDRTRRRPIDLACQLFRGRTSNRRGNTSEKKSVAVHLSSEENSEESMNPDSCDIAAGTRSALLMRC